MENRSRSPSTKNLSSLESINYLDPHKTNNHHYTSTTTTTTSSSSTSDRSPVVMNQLLNNMSQRVMTKPKYGGLCMNLTQRLRNSSKCFILVVILFFFTYLSFYYFEVSPKTLPVLSKDRAADYKVKVLPATLSDEELDKLPKETFSYLTMIDAGSSGCRAHIYRYGKLGNAEGPLYILPQHNSKKIKPGLSSFANNPNDAGVSLTGLIEFMKEQVPPADWEVTPIWLKATAGLRMLPTSTSDAILESVRSFLLNKSNSPFLFRSSWARVIPGNEEGGFGWIAFNYLKKIIGPKRNVIANHRSQPYTVIEMGGASAQVSQLAPSPEEANKIPHDYRFSFEIEGEEYHLYTHSYLGYGAEQAKEQYLRILQKNAAAAAALEDPCKHDGFTGASRKSRHMRRLQGLNETTSPATATTPIAASSSATATAADKTSSSANLNRTAAANAETTVKPKEAAPSNPPVLPTKRDRSLSCVKNVASLFNSGIYDKCAVSGPFSFGCVHQPEFVTKSPNILAFENFYYVSSAIGVRSIHHKNGNASLPTTFPLETTPALLREASEKFCGLNWAEVQQSYPKDNQPKDVNQKICFIGAFAYSFLVDGLKIPVNKVITIQREVGPSEIEWALGAAYKETADLLKRTHLRPV